MAQLQQAEPDADGSRRLALLLPASEAALICALPGQLAALLAHPDANRRVIERLFPPGYADPAQEREHRALLGASLVDSRRELLAAVGTLLASGERTRAGLRLRFNAAGADVLLRFINDMRLVLATELGIEKNLGEISVQPGDPEAPRYALLVYLGGLESVLVEALIGDPGA